MRNIAFTKGPLNSITLGVRPIQHRHITVRSAGIRLFYNLLRNMHTLFAFIVYLPQDRFASALKRRPKIFISPVDIMLDERISALK